MKLQDKVAIITGGNSGIGLATAREFKANGAKLVSLGATARPSMRRLRACRSGLNTPPRRREFPKPKTTARKEASKCLKFYIESE